MTAITPMTAAPRRMVAADRPPRHRPWLIVAGLVLAAHGMIHLLGFAVDWRLAALREMPYRSTILAGHVAVGTAGMRILGLLWLLAALGFIAVGAGLAFRSARRLWRQWRGPMLAVTLLSLALCLLAWPDSAFGAVTDLALLAVVFAGPRFTAVQRARQGRRMHHDADD